MIRLALADDHAIVRGGLHQIMATSSDIEVVAEAASSNEAIEMARHDGIDLLLLDISLPGVGGLEVIKVLAAERPGLPVLVLSMHNEGQIVRRALKSGAAGYVTKDSEPSVLLCAIRKVASGGKYIDPALVDSVVFPQADQSDHPQSLLSEREYQILQFIVAGVQLGDIADRLHLSPKTISTHKMRLMQKLGVNNNADLVRYALRHGVVPF